MSTKLPDVDVVALQETNATRKQLIEQLMPNGVAPADAKDIRNILTALKDIDSQQLSIAKINAENESAQDDRETALQIAKMSEKISAGTNPFLRSEPVQADKGQLPQAEVVEGEFDTSAGEGRFDEFIKRNEDSEGNFIGSDK